jgi:Allantoicase repeat
MTGLAPVFIDDVSPRVRAKLAQQPIEDLRVDFEDGYGITPDDEEDAAAVAAGRAPAATAHEVNAPLPRTTLRPDTLHRFRIGGDAVTHVRMEVFPDGGMSRVRLWGEFDRAALEALTVRWLGPLPPAHLAEVLARVPELTPAEADSVRSRRTLTSAGIPAALRAHLLPD